MCCIGTVEVPRPCCTAAQDGLLSGRPWALPLRRLSGVPGVAWLTSPCPEATGAIGCAHFQQWGCISFAGRKC
ncbi:hypothetical protein SALBM311S_02833 [Streptomyces alboniger]